MLVGVQVGTHSRHVSERTTIWDQHGANMRTIRGSCVDHMGPMWTLWALYGNICFIYGIETYRPTDWPTERERERDGQRQTSRNGHTETETMPETDKESQGQRETDRSNPTARQITKGLKNQRERTTKNNWNWIWLHSGRCLSILVDLVAFSCI